MRKKVTFPNKITLRTQIIITKIILVVVVEEEDQIVAIDQTTIGEIETNHSVIYVPSLAIVLIDASFGMFLLEQIRQVFLLTLFFLQLVI